MIKIGHSGESKPREIQIARVSPKGTAMIVSPEILDIMRGR